MLLTTLNSQCNPKIRLVLEIPILSFILFFLPPFFLLHYVLRSYWPHLKVRDSIWRKDWSHSLQTFYPTFSEFSSAIRECVYSPPFHPIVTLIVWHVTVLTLGASSCWLVTLKATGCTATVAWICFVTSNGSTHIRNMLMLLLRYVSVLLLAVMVQTTYNVRFDGIIISITALVINLYCISCILKIHACRIEADSREYEEEKE